jgi:hypothetical protein
MAVCGPPVRFDDAANFALRVALAVSCFAGVTSHLVGMSATQLQESDSLDDRARIAALEAEVARLELEIEYLRPFAPPRPPDGYVVVKEAAYIARCSEELIYKRRRLGKLVSTKVRARIWIDPNTLPVQTD